MRARIVWLGVLAVAVTVGAVLATRDSEDPEDNGKRRVVTISTYPALAPRGWQVVKPRDDVPEWDRQAVKYLNDALYFLEVGLPESDPRRRALREVDYLPFSRLADRFPTHTENAVAIFDMNTGTVHVKTKDLGHYFQVVSSLAHELDHAAHDKRIPINAFHRADIEHRAHSGEAEVLEHLCRYVRSLQRPSGEEKTLWLDVLEEERRRTLSLSAMYGVRVSLFRLIQAVENHCRTNPSAQLDLLGRDLIALAEGSDMKAEFWEEEVAVRSVERALQVVPSANDSAVKERIRDWRQACALAKARHKATGQFRLKE